MYKIIKRCFDFICAFVALVVLSPIFLLTMIGILVSDWGPIFYKANRIGKGNKPFKMYKFRSMRQQTDEEELALVELVVLEEEVRQHEAEIDIQTADIGYFACVAHSFVRAHDKAFCLRDADHNRHSDEAEHETDKADQIAMRGKKILYHCGSNCS